MAAYSNEDEFCRRCGRPFDESEELIIDVDLDDAVEYIFDQLVKEGILAKRDDLENVIQLFHEFISLKEM